MNIRIRLFCENCRRSYATISTTAVKKRQICPFATERASKTKESTSPMLDKHVLCDQQKAFEAVKISDFVKPFETIPGPKGLPGIGSSYKYLPGFEYDARDIYQSHKRKYEKYGSVVKENLHGNIIVHLFNPNDFATVFRREGKFPVRGEIKGIKKYREERNKCVGLMNLKGEEWHRLRSKVAQEILLPHRVSSYITAQEPVANDLVKLIKMKRDVQGEVDNFLNDLYRWSMESIGVVCFNTRLGTLDKATPEEDVQNFINAIGTFMQKLNLMVYFWSYHKYGRSKAWQKFCSSLDLIWKVSKKHYHKSMSKTRNNNSETFLTRLTANGNMSTDEAITMTNDLFFASIDTAGHSMGFLLYQLARNPDKQSILYKEICDNVPKDKPLSLSSLAKLPYLKASVKESIRLFPVIGTASRNVCSDIILGGYHIPKGTKVMAHSMFTSKSEEYFENAEQFIPERWLRDNNKMVRSHPYAFLPFGYGGRGCIGRRIAEQQLYLATVKLIQHFRVDYKYENIGMLTRTVNKPDKPLRFAFIDR